MIQSLKMLRTATSLSEIQDLIDAIVDDCVHRRVELPQIRQFLHILIFQKHLVQSFTGDGAVDHLLTQIAASGLADLFRDALQTELPDLLVNLVRDSSDVSHMLLFRLCPQGGNRWLLSALARLNSYLEEIPEPRRYLSGMRVAKIQADIYRRLADDGESASAALSPCCIDNQRIRDLKSDKRLEELPLAYEELVGQLQRLDLHRALSGLRSSQETRAAPARGDPEICFRVEAPLRIGISSANASDNHLRSKEQGAKTLNAAIDLQFEGEPRPMPPITVAVRRLREPGLRLRSRSLQFEAAFEANTQEEAMAQSAVFFAYRRGGDEALRLVKQALVHTGIIRDNSEDVLGDVANFTGGGLEITTRSKVLQGSGLGTSILAAAILKALYWLTKSPHAAASTEYPDLYDQSLLLEQSLGLNSGWQDARGALGGPSAIKDFCALPTTDLPAPSCTFLKSVDPAAFTERIVLFDTGIARSATRGLNVLLNAYLARDPQRYPAFIDLMAVHDEMVEALTAGDYASLGRWASRYWQLRCHLDPYATSPTLQLLFEGTEITQFTEGGLLTGAGGGGFALLVAGESQTEPLKQALGKLSSRSEYSRSSVVEYALNDAGIRLIE